MPIRRVYNICLWAVLDKRCTPEYDALVAFVNDTSCQPQSRRANDDDGTTTPYPQSVYADVSAWYPKRLTTKRVSKIVARFVAEWHDVIAAKLQPATAAAEDDNDTTGTRSAPPSKQPMCAYGVKLRPTPHQRRVLNAHVRASNHAYNWCLWLVENGYCRSGPKNLPNQCELQRIVATSKSPCDDMDAYRPCRVSGTRGYCERGTV